MCGGSTKIPEQKPLPTPSPAPTPVEPTEVAAIGQSDRRKKLSRLRSGFQSTIRTSARGTTGKSVDLFAPSLVGGKAKLGQ